MRMRKRWYRATLAALSPTGAESNFQAKKQKEEEQAEQEEERINQLAQEYEEEADAYRQRLERERQQHEEKERQQQARKRASSDATEVPSAEDPTPTESFAQEIEWQGVRFTKVKLFHPKQGKQGCWLRK